MFLSIIIPIYNKEQYLPECLNSCLEQDIPTEDYEIICVNDGSTDGSMAVAEKYAMKYRNIVLINRENGGISAARNSGIDKAKGNYIWIVDPDDIIITNCLGGLKAQAEKYQFDRLTFKHYKFIEKLSESEIKLMMQNKLTPTTLSRDNSVNFCLWKRDFLTRNGLKFREKITNKFDTTHMQSGEDLMFVYECNRHQYMLKEIEEVLYLYRKNSDSITGTITIESKIAKMNNFLQIAAQVKEIYDEEKSSGEVTELTANKLMEFLRKGLRYLAQLRGGVYRYGKKMLKDAGLMPFRQPKECKFTSKEFAAEPNAMQMGKAHTFFLYHCNTRWGLCGLTCFYRLSPKWRSLKKNIKHLLKNA